MAVALSSTFVLFVFAPAPGRARPIDRSTDQLVVVSKTPHLLPAIRSSRAQSAVSRGEGRKKTSLNGDRPDSRGKCHVMQHVRFVDAVAWVTAIGQNIYCANWITCWINGIRLANESERRSRPLERISLGFRLPNGDINSFRKLVITGHLDTRQYLIERSVTQSSEIQTGMSWKTCEMRREETQQVHIAVSLHCRQSGKNKFSRAT